MAQVRVFISYAHEDREWCERLLDHLGWLRHAGGLAVFEDKQIKPGEAWDARIHGELSQAAVVLLLVSPHFIGSRYCSLETGKTIIPVLLDHVDLEPLPIAARQCLPKDEHQNLLPLVEWRNPNRALAAIAAAIRNEVAQLSGDAGPATQPLVPLPRREIDALGRAPVSLWLGRAAALLALAASLAIAAGAVETLPALRTARATYSLLVKLGTYALPGALVLAQVAFELAHARRTRRQRERALHSEVRDIGYFRPLDRDRFTRADRAHERILGWIESAPAPVLYLDEVPGRDVLAECQRAGTQCLTLFIVRLPPSQHLSQQRQCENGEKREGQAVAIKKAAHSAPVRVRPSQQNVSAYGWFRKRGTAGRTAWKRAAPSEMPIKVSRFDELRVGIAAPEWACRPLGQSPATPAWRSAPRNASSGISPNAAQANRSRISAIHLPSSSLRNSDNPSFARWQSQASRSPPFRCRLPCCCWARASSG